MLHIWSYHLHTFGLERAEQLTTQMNVNCKLAVQTLPDPPRPCWTLTDPPDPPTPSKTLLNPPRPSGPSKTLQDPPRPYWTLPDPPDPPRPSQTLLPWIQNKKKSRSRVGGWSKEILEPTLALQSTAWIQNPSSSRVWQNQF